MALQHKDKTFVPVNEDYEPMDNPTLTCKGCCKQCCTVLLVLIVTSIIALPNILALIVGYHPNAFGGDSETNLECIHMKPDSHILLEFMVNQNTKQILVIGGWVTILAFIFMSMMACCAIGCKLWGCAFCIMLIIVAVDLFFMWCGWAGFHLYSNLPNYCQQTPAVKMLLAFEILNCIYFWIVACIGCCWVMSEEGRRR